MKYLPESLRTLLGKAPARFSREKMEPLARQIHDFRRSRSLTPNDLEEMARIHRERGRYHYWRNRRWSVLILVNLLFVLSYHLDFQLLEGSLSASRIVFLQMADINASVQVWLASHDIFTGLTLGTLGALFFWILLGGRTFCSWVCPYHLLSEWAEKLHLYLLNKKLVDEHSLHRGTRSALYLLFAAAAFFSGYTVYETINPVGILSRALIYGSSLSLAWIGALLFLEIFHVRRLWCRYACPVGLTYAVTGLVSPLRVRYNLTYCQHEGECLKVCLVPHVLDCVKKGRAQEEEMFLGADCTRCGMCIDACPTDSLSYEMLGIKKLKKIF